MPRAKRTTAATTPTPVAKASSIAAPAPAKAAKKPARAGKSKPGAKIGAPTLWTPELEDAIVQTLEDTGCSFRDAAEINGISHETLKLRQRKPKGKAGEDPFLTRMAHARLSTKTRSLGYIQAAAKEGEWRAASWYLERAYRDEYGRSDVTPNDGPGSGGAAAAIGAGGAAGNLIITQILVNDPGALGSFHDLLGRIGGVGRADDRARVAGGDDDDGHAQRPVAVATVPASPRDRSRPH